MPLQGDEHPSFTLSMIPHSTQDLPSSTLADPAAQIPPPNDTGSFSSHLPGPESPLIDLFEIDDFLSPADAPEDGRPWSTDADMPGVNAAAAPQAAPPVSVGGDGHAGPWSAMYGIAEIQPVEEDQRRFGSIKSPVLTLAKLRQSTNKFSPNQLLGKGAFGEVYEGDLPNGDVFAVKRFASTITGLQDVAPQVAPRVPVGGGGHNAPWCATACRTKIQHLEEDAQRRLDSWKLSDDEQSLLGEVVPLKPCSVADESKGVEEDGRGLKRILTCRGLNSPQSPPTPLVWGTNKHGLTVSYEKLVVEAPAPAPAPEDGRPSGRDVRQLGGAETSRRGRATAPRQQQPPHGHGVGRQSPSLTPRRGRRQSPSAIALFLLSKKGKHVRREAKGLRRPCRVSNATSSRCNMLGSVVLTLDLLRQITNNFSDDQDQLLGEGAFGKVYKGVLPNGDTIAVKRFASTISGLQDAQYENEAQHLMRLKHPNIVQLVGYCSETKPKLVWHNGTIVRAEEPERLLCLEYMPKGSLRDRLSDKTSRLEWDTCYKIIEGICNGLHYLHEEWQATPIIHMDLKPANILLDDNMVPKIADFGLSRLLGEDQTRTSTASCKGTRGYMPPEYVDRGVITKMYDIFSLGVIIIEIITGLKDYPTDETETTSQQYIDLVLNNWRHGLTKAQGYTSQDIDYQQIKKCIQIGLLCVKFDPVKRPTINQIIKMLEASDEAYQNEREVMERQDAMQQRFLEAIEKREQDRMIREEAWLQQMTRVAREQEILAAILSIIQKKGGRCRPLLLTEDHRPDHPDVH